MAQYFSANEAASLAMGHTFTDSEDESEIEEEPNFPLPQRDNDDAVLDSASGEQPHLSATIPAQQPLSSSGYALSSTQKVALLHQF